MFRLDDKVKVTCGKHEGKIGYIRVLHKGRDLPYGVETQEPFYAVEFEDKTTGFDVPEECLEAIS